MSKIHDTPPIDPSALGGASSNAKHLGKLGSRIVSVQLYKVMSTFLTKIEAAIRNLFNPEKKQVTVKEITQTKINNLTPLVRKSLELTESGKTKAKENAVTLLEVKYPKALLMHLVDTIQFGEGKPSATIQLDQKVSSYINSKLDLQHSGKDILDKVKKELGIEEIHTNQQSLAVYSHPEILGKLLPENTQSTDVRVARNPEQTQVQSKSFIDETYDEIFGDTQPTDAEPQMDYMDEVLALIAAQSSETQPQIKNVLTVNTVAIHNLH